MLPGAHHPCAEIVHRQRADGFSAFQVPEPWHGDLAHAPILCLSSNPSISAVEDYPDWAWQDDFITDFFTHRFASGRREWVHDGRYSLLKTGEHSRHAVAFWSSVQCRAVVLLRG